MRDCEIEAMIEALRKIQSEHYLSLSGLAHKLGISTSHLSMVFSGRRQPGLHFVRAVMEQFPEIRQLIAVSLQRAAQDGERRPHKSLLSSSEADAVR